MNTPAKQTLVNGCLFGVLPIVGFWGMPLLLTALERLVPLLGTRWGYVFLLYGTSRWMGSVGILWIIWTLRRLRLPAVDEQNPLRRFADFGIFVAGILWLLLYTVCADPTMWFEGDASELLLFESERQAKLFLGGLIAVNCLTKWFGFLFIQAEAGAVNLHWTGSTELLELWLGLLVESALFSGVIIGVLWSVRSWRSCVWLRQMAYGWWGLVVFHAAVAPRTLHLDDPLPLILKMLILGVFTTTLFAVMWKLRPAV